MIDTNSVNIMTLIVSNKNGKSKVFFGGQGKWLRDRGEIRRGIQQEVGSDAEKLAGFGTLCLALIFGLQLGHQIPSYINSFRVITQLCNLQ
jgi:hypothetical protein